MRKRILQKACLTAIALALTGNLTGCIEIHTAPQTTEQATKQTTEQTTEQATEQTTEQAAEQITEQTTPEAGGKTETRQTETSQPGSEARLADVPQKQAETQKADFAQTGRSTGEITMEQAKACAYQHAGVAADTIQYSTVKPDWENGKLVYEVEFVSGGVEYDCDVLAEDGSVVQYSFDDKGSKNIQSAGQGQSVTLEQAKQLVADRIPGVDISGIYMKEDWDDGQKRYEGSTYYNSSKYEFEIDASTGRFLEWDVERR